VISPATSKHFTLCSSHSACLYFEDDEGRTLSKHIPESQQKVKIGTYKLQEMQNIIKQRRNKVHSKHSEINTKPIWGGGDHICHQVLGRTNCLFYSDMTWTSQKTMCSIILLPVCIHCHNNIFTELFRSNRRGYDTNEMGCVPWHTYQVSQRLDEAFKSRWGGFTDTNSMAIS
jgi:hypothetical protein